MANLQDLGIHEVKPTVTQRLASMLSAAKPRRRAKNGRHARLGIWKKLLRRNQPSVIQAAVLPEVLSSREIDVAVMTMNRLAPATFRAAASGKPVRLSAPDSRTANLFRAALAVSQRDRSTDRLIEVVIEGDRNAA